MKPELKRHERRRITKAAKNRAFKRKSVVRCVYCGKGLTRHQATGDHRQPISGGGANKTKNIVIACHDCNQRKGSLYPGAFMQLIRATAQRRNSAIRSRGAK